VGLLIEGMAEGVEEGGKGWVWSVGGWDYSFGRGLWFVRWGGGDVRRAWEG